MYTHVTVKQILERKGPQVWSVEPDVSVLDALRFMAEKNIGALVVLQNENPVGIFSERDYARKIALQGKNERETRVEEVMTHEVICVESDYEMDACLALMTNKFIRHLPVVEEEKIVGVISIGDVVKELIADQKFVIDQLVHYISGERQKPAIPEPSEVELP
jgi:CBS domain-containing protein